MPPNTQPERASLLLVCVVSDSTGRSMHDPQSSANYVADGWSLPRATIGSACT
jgi:hypothetical protein